MRAMTAALLMTGVLVFGVAAQPRVPREPVLPKTTEGAELFRFYCANCHGADATGRPATAVTQKPAPNLTMLARDHGGQFPRDAVRDIIVNGGAKGSAHRTSDMPVWGTIFRAFEPSDAMVNVRVDNLVRYIEALQDPGTGTRRSN